MMQLPTRAITIAGSAAGGSAGIQADLKTFQELDIYGMSVVTAIVARHPETDKNVHVQTIEAIEAQFATAMKQVGTDALKTGMLFSKAIIEKAADLIEGSGVKIKVVDPVMVGKLDSKLLADDAIDVLKNRLVPLADVITPNVPEASYLLDGRELKTVEDMKEAAVDLHELGPQYVLVKGGRLKGAAVDVLYDGEKLMTFEAPRINTENTSGEGCTYSAAIASYMTKGYAMPEAVRLAKSFVTTAIEHGFTYTEMVGPTYHAAERMKGEAHTIKVDELS